MTLLALTVSALLGATAPAATLQPQGWVEPSGASLSGTSGPRGLAQDAGGERSEPRRKLRVIRLEELKIEGRIQKPQAFYLLQRSSLNFDDLNREESFLDKVVEAVEKPPF